ncbi:MAG TPA: flavin oxidoreductase/NADH oxidase [Armatimonadetes bacterium]|nr:flavin oxidoreductase/NADH oxidase [Armatimonadota bacterium]
MAFHEKFRFRCLSELAAKVEEVGVDLPLATSIEKLKEPVAIGPFTAPNRLAVHPMEGCDGTVTGSPDALTYRRYERFARSGAGLLWFEATAIVPEGRANPRQLCLQEKNVRDFAELLAETRRIAQAEFGPSFEPVCVLQLTHSGRYSRPVKDPQPLLAHHSPYLDPKVHVSSDYPLLSDGELEALEERYVEVAKLARQAGFQGVDIKHCHCYLGSELLAAFTREGRYGGSYENRTRFLKNIVGKIRHELPDLMVTVRLNAYDGIPYPYGWGVSPEEEMQPDLTEPKRLVRELYALGVPMVNISAGNPYYNPHLGRPFDTPIVGAYIPPEHPLEGVARLVHLAREVQQHVPEMVVVGTGYSWLRQFWGYAAEAVVRQGWATIVGLGRGAFAHPTFARDLLSGKPIDPKAVCITCSRCTQIMRDGGRTGCVPRDREVYGPLYREGRRRFPTEKPRRWIGVHL